MARILEFFGSLALLLKLKNLLEFKGKKKINSSFYLKGKFEKANIYIYCTFDNLH